MSNRSSKARHISDNLLESFMSLFLQVAVVAVVASVVAVSVEVEVVVADGDSRPKEDSQNPES